MPVTHFTLMIVTYIRVSALDAFDIFHRAPLNSMTYITVPLMTLKYFYNSALDANISKTAPLITVTYFTVSALDTRDILQLCSSALNQTNSLLCARVSGADVVQGSFIILPYHSGFQRSMIYDLWCRADIWKIREFSGPMSRLAKCHECHKQHLCTIFRAWENF